MKADAELQYYLARDQVLPEILLLHFRCHQIIEKDFPFSSLKGGANVLIFPDLNSGNIAYKLMARIGGATVIGPVLRGMKKPIHVLQRGATVDDIINMTAIAVVDSIHLVKPAKKTTEAALV